MNHVVHGAPLLPRSGGSWCGWASVMKSSSSRVQPFRSLRWATPGCVSPACDKRINASRKLATEFIDVGGEIIVIVVMAFVCGPRRERCACAQPLQVLQGLGQHAE